MQSEVSDVPDSSSPQLLQSSDAGSSLELVAEVEGSAAQRDILVVNTDALVPPPLDPLPVTHFEICSPAGGSPRVEDPGTNTQANLPATSSAQDEWFGGPVVEPVPPVKVETAIPRSASFFGEWGTSSSSSTASDVAEEARRRLAEAEEGARRTYTDWSSASSTLDAVDRLQGGMTAARSLMYWGWSMTRETAEDGITKAKTGLEQGATEVTRLTEQAKTGLEQSATEVTRLTERGLTKARTGLEQGASEVTRLTEQAKTGLEQSACEVSRLTEESICKAKTGFEQISSDTAATASAAKEAAAGKLEEISSNIQPTLDELSSQIQPKFDEISNQIQPTLDDATETARTSLLELTSNAAKTAEWLQTLGGSTDHDSNYSTDDEDDSRGPATFMRRPAGDPAAAVHSGVALAGAESESPKICVDISAALSAQSADISISKESSFNAPVVVANPISVDDSAALSAQSADISISKESSFNAPVVVANPISVDDSAALSAQSADISISEESSFNAPVVVANPISVDDSSMFAGQESRVLHAEHPSSVGITVAG